MNNVTNFVQGDHRQGQAHRNETSRMRQGQDLLVEPRRETAGRSMQRTSPIVNFIDQQGFMIGPEAERNGTIRYGMAAVCAAAQATCLGRRFRFTRASAWPPPRTTRRTTTCCCSASRSFWGRPRTEV